MGRHLPLDHRGRGGDGRRVRRSVRPALFARLSSGQVAVPGQTQDGTALLEKLPKKTGASVILLLDRIDLKSAVLKKQIALARKDVLALDFVAGEKDPFARHDTLFDRDSPPASKQGLADLAAAIPLVSQDRTALLMIVDLKPSLDTEPTNTDLAEITEGGATKSTPALFP